MRRVVIHGVVVHAAAAAMILGSSAGRAARTQADAPTTAPSADRQVVVNSTSQPSAPGVKEIQATLGKVVEAATSKGELDTLASLLAKPERDRMSDARTKSWPDLDGRIDQFRKDWQAKYGQDFKVDDKQSVVFNDQNVHITTVEAIASSGTDARTAADRTTTAPPSTAPTTGEFARSTSRSATVEFAALANLPPLKIKLINEGTLVPSWRVDLPDTVDAQKLHDNLLKQLTMLGEDKANWPSDVNQAYEMVTRHVLVALVDTEAQSASAANQMTQ